jgi:putative tricarboxylic transport membrane protein
MRRHHLLDREILCGVLFVTLGGATLLYATQYPRGSLTDMGPGYFPTMLGAVLVFFGAVIGLGSLLMAAPRRVAPLPLRPLLAITASPLCFAALLDWIGLPLSVFCAALVACAARPAFLRPWAFLLSAVLALICVLVFVTALGVPVRLWPAVVQRF